jgi:hypothetical protein
MTVCLLQACSAGHAVSGDRPLPLQMADISATNRFGVVITTGKATVTGVMVAKYIDRVWKGALVNEFGVKIFDFISSPQACTLLNVVSFIDRRHVKKTIAADLRFLFEIDHPEYPPYRKAKRRIRQDTLEITCRSTTALRFADGNIRLENKKRGIVYLFTPLNDQKRNVSTDE